MVAKFHVLMCAYNTGKFIKHSLDSIYRFAESITVIEGGWNPTKEKRSSDNTQEIIQDYISNHDLDKKVHSIVFNQYNPIDNYPNYVNNHHKKIVKNALYHPYYDGPSLQQQLLARDIGLKSIINCQIKSNYENEWLWIVDSDEIYAQESAENLVEFVSTIGDDYDFFTINGMNFYFNEKWYTNEWYRRVFKIKPRCFFSDDNSLEIPNKLYTKTMNIPIEICSFFHYNYIDEFRVEKKLQMWKKDQVEKWLNKHRKMIRNEQEYNGSNVHLFGDLNPGYSNYKLQKFSGKHPKEIFS